MVAAKVLPELESDVTAGVLVRRGVEKVEKPGSKKVGTPLQRKLVVLLAAVLGLAIVIVAVLASSGPSGLDPPSDAAAAPTSQPTPEGVAVPISSSSSLLKLYWYGCLEPNRERQAC